jgi:hypothetical protein
VVHQVSEPPHIPPADIIVPRQLQHRISCTAVSRLIRALDTRKTRARLDRWSATARSSASASRAPTARSICSGGIREQLGASKPAKPGDFPRYFPS